MEMGNGSNFGMEMTNSRRSCDFLLFHKELKNYESRNLIRKCRLGPIIDDDDSPQKAFRVSDPKAGIEICG